MSLLHGLPRLGIGSIGSIGVFREVQDALEVLHHHFAGCANPEDIVTRFVGLEIATRLGVVGYAAVLLGVVYTAYFLARSGLTAWIHRKAHALVEANKANAAQQRRKAPKP